MAMFIVLKDKFVLHLFAHFWISWESVGDVLCVMFLMF